MDESGNLKNGNRTVEVQWQHSGMAGRIEIRQIAAYLALATAAGHVVVDVRLYLPKSGPGTPNGADSQGCPGRLASPPSPS